MLQKEVSEQYTTKVLFTDSVIRMIKEGSISELKDYFDDVRDRIKADNHDVHFEYKLLVLSIHVETCCRILAKRDMEAIAYNADYMTAYLGGEGWKKFIQ